ncbi:MAG: glycosyl hydrolase 53 family protein [Spirochaetales bacterium]|nr:glycosyl hydrolase 53 family protein [Spirochaetales bacterium]
MKKIDKNYSLIICTLIYVGIINIVACVAGKQSANHLQLKEPITTHDNLSMVFTFPGDVNTWTAENIYRTYETLSKAGIRISNLYYTWNDIENTKDSCNWQELDFNIAVIKKHGLKVSLEIKIIDTNKIGQLPEDIIFSSFDDSRFIKRFSDFILVLLDRYNKQVSYIWIGNEIDDFLYNKRELLDGWLVFYNEIYAAIKNRHPYIQVGTVSTYHDAKRNMALDIIGKSGRIGDIIGFSFYPQMLKNANPNEIREYFAEMSVIAKKLNKKYAITESGWSSEGFDGSEDRQTQFIQELISVYRMYKADIEYLGLFVSYDVPEDVNKAVASNYGLEEHMEFLKFQGTLGLAYNNGRPKQAWYAFINAISVLVDKL